MGTASGVYGAGFDVLTNSSALPYHAFITFGDNTTLDVALPVGASFFGITSKLDIQSIHLGLAGGGFTTLGQFQIDNLTIGNIPAPGVLVLLGLAGFASRRRRRR
ncbi:MAG: PEP-CTERM sorting domain-containing protein [Planctomycetes bacterium]|nr:PEP-CTERM sorting domain-containing protein [Planctomycetota bacterium]